MPDLYKTINTTKKGEGSETRETSTTKSTQTSRQTPGKRTSVQKNPVQTQTQQQTPGKTVSVSTETTPAQSAVTVQSAATATEENSGTSRAVSKEDTGVKISFTLKVRKWLPDC
jgi:hypothetical protein